MIQTITREALPTPKIIDNKLCVLEYTTAQRSYLAYRSVFSSPVTLSPAACPVPGDPHAMTVSVGMTCVDGGGEAIPYIVTEHVPGVLVQSDEFVSGFHFGMCDAFDASDWGDESIPEQEAVNMFVSIAADAVMLGNAEIPSAFSAGYIFGYVRGCTLVGTEAFQQWANGGSRVAS